MKAGNNRQRGLRAFARDASAAASVEFALILPVMALLYVAVFEIADGVMTSRNLSNVARTLVDLVSRQPTSAQASSTPAPANAVSASTLTGILNASQTLIYPQPTAPLSMTVSAVDVTNTVAGVCCTARVRWSYTTNGTLRPCGTPLTGTNSNSPGPSQLPAAMLPTGTALSQPLAYLIADTAYTFQPMIGYAQIPFSFSMTRTVYSLPRASGQVVTGTLQASGTYYGQVCY